MIGFKMVVSRFGLAGEMIIVLKVVSRYSKGTVRNDTKLQAREIKSSARVACGLKCNRRCTTSSYVILCVGICARPYSRKTRERISATNPNWVLASTSAASLTSHLHTVHHCDSPFSITPAFLNYEVDDHGYCVCGQDRGFHCAQVRLVPFCCTRLVTSLVHACGTIAHLSL